MVNYCPVCKARIWTDPLFSGRLKCPRCGAEFAPKVPWSYFRALLLFSILLALTTILAVVGKSYWLLLLFFLIVAGIFWYLPRLIHLDPVPPDLRLADGPDGRAEVEMKLELGEWEKSREEDQKSRGTGFYFAAALILLIAVLVILFLLRN